MIQLDKIKTITIEATSFCNLHCPQCPRFDQEGFLAKNLQPGNLNFDNFKRNFDLSLLSNIDTVKFEGDYGDFMMHPDAYKFLLFFESIPNLHVVTNGSLRSPSWWATLAKFKNLTVTFSIDGLEDTNHIYRINSNFNKIIANAKAYIQSGGRANWKYIVFKHNEHQIEQARLFSETLGFQKFTSVPTDRSWWTGDTWAVKIDGEYQYDISKSKLAGTSRKIESVVAFENIQKTVSTNQPAKIEQKMKLNCWLNRGDMFINYLGHVLPCCMTSGKTWQKTIAGKLWQRLVGNMDGIDLNKNHLKDIINGDFYQHRLAQSFQSPKTLHTSCVSYCT